DQHHAPTIQQNGFSVAWTRRKQKPPTPTGARRLVPSGPNRVSTATNQPHPSPFHTSHTLKGCELVVLEPQGRCRPMTHHCLRPLSPPPPPDGYAGSLPHHMEVAVYTGGVPPATSGTATLLPLRTNRQPHLRRRPPTRG